MNKIPTRKWSSAAQIPVRDNLFSIANQKKDHVSQLIWLRDEKCLALSVGDSWHLVPASETSLHLDQYACSFVSEHSLREPCGVFVSDDGALADYELLGPLCADKNVPFVLGIVRDYVGSQQGVGYMNHHQLVEMAAMGCEMAGHTLSHPDLALLNENQTRKEIEESVAWMRDHGWTCNHFVYPYGAYQLSSERSVERVCDTACIVTGGVAKPPFFRTRVPRHALGSFFYQGINSFSGYKILVDDAVREKRMLIWMLHPWSDQHDANQQAILKDIVDYMRDQGMKICNMTEAWKMHGNLWESSASYGDEWIIDCDGRVWKSFDPWLGGGKLFNYLMDSPRFAATLNSARAIKGRFLK